jgi:hypothetical protein
MYDGHLAAEADFAGYPEAFETSAKWTRKQELIELVRAIRENPSLGVELRKAINDAASD